MKAGRQVMILKSKESSLRILTLLLILCGLFSWGDTGEVAEARALIEEQNYKEAKDKLIQLTISRKLDVETKVDAHMALALFYRNLVGELDLAKIQFQRIVRLKLPEGNLLKKKAKDELDSLRREQTEFAEQYDTLKQVAGYTEDTDLQKQYLDKLETLLNEHADFPGIGKANYWYGYYLDRQGRYFEAMNAYDKAESQLPAINEILAVNSSYKLARKEAVRTTTPLICRTVIAVIFLIGIVLFIRSRPKSWMKRAHFSLLGKLLIGWIVTFLVISVIIFFVDLNEDNLSFFRPIFVRKLWYQKGAYRLITVFLQGIFVLAGVFLISAGTAKWQYRTKRLVVTLLTALFLGIAFSGNYYVTYLVDDSQHKEGLLGGTMYTLIATNKHEMPKDLEAVKEMVGSAGKAQIRELLEYYLELDDDAKDLSKYTSLSDDEIAGLLFKKAKEKESR